MQQQRDLLFALLALQNDFIKQEQLLKAFGAWLADKSNSLITILVEQRAIGSDDVSLFDRLVDKHLERFGGDATQSLANLSGIDSLGEELKQLAEGDSDALLTVSYLPCTSRSSLGTSSYATHAGDKRDSGIKVQAGSSENRFRIVKEHAKGGLGVVFVAEDQHLKREVALKQIRQDRADIDVYRQKFLQEAEVTGQLEHPGIVPVYALGSDNHGRPYYAMRFIKGEDLQSRIRQFHADVKSSKCNFDGPELRGLLRRFIDVCNAIDYAHDRGVLHRDLKPGNVMLGKYGETLVVDWGLAKPLGQKPGRDPDATQGLESEIPVPRTDSENSDTRYGTFLGTRAYAPPEQLLGQLDRLCPASDVYALGAILYELLTGQPPKVQSVSSDKELAEAILAGKIAEPRSLAPTVPKPLEAVCLKAMSPLLESRYSDAHALRGDIENWLDDAAVTAYAEPLTDRIRRWSRNHRTLVASSMVTLVTLAMAALVVVALQSKANREIAKERDEANDARDAESRLRFESQVATARIQLEKGLDKANDGNIGEGISWMARSLATHPVEETQVSQAANYNLNLWLAQEPTFIGAIEVDASVGDNRIAISLNGTHAAFTDAVGVDGKVVQYVTVVQIQPAIKVLKRSRLPKLVTAIEFRETTSSYLISLVNGTLVELSSDGQVLHQTQPVAGMITALKISSTGRVFVAYTSQSNSGSSHRVAKLDDSCSAVDKQLLSCDSDITQLSISFDESRLVAATTNRVVYDLRLLTNTKPDSFSIGGVVRLVQADQALMVCTSNTNQSNELEVWSISKRAKLGSTISASNDVTDLSYSPQGKALFVQGKNLDVTGWSLESFRPTWRYNTPLAPLGTCVSANGNVCATLCVGKKGIQLRAYRLPPQDDSVRSFSQGSLCGFQITSAHQAMWTNVNGEVHVQDLASGKIVATVNASFRTPTLSCSDGLLVGQVNVGQEANRLTLWNNKNCFQSNSNPINETVTYASKLSQRSPQLLGFSTVEKSIGLAQFDGQWKVIITKPIGFYVYGIAWVEQGQKLLCGLHDGTIRLFDRSLNEIATSPHTVDSEIIGLAVSPSENMAVVTTRFGTVYSFALPSLDLIRSARSENGVYPRCCFSQDGEFLSHGYDVINIRDAKSLIQIGPSLGTKSARSAGMAWTSDRLYYTSDLVNGFSLLKQTRTGAPENFVKDTVEGIVRDIIGQGLTNDGEIQVISETPTSTRRLAHVSKVTATDSAYKSWLDSRAETGKQAELQWSHPIGPTRVLADIESNLDNRYECSIHSNTADYTRCQLSGDDFEVSWGLSRGELDECNKQMIGQGKQLTSLLEYQDANETRFIGAWKRSMHESQYALGLDSSDAKKRHSEMESNGFHAISCVPAPFAPANTTQHFNLLWSREPGENTVLSMATPIDRWNGKVEDQGSWQELFNGRNLYTFSLAMTETGSQLRAFSGVWKKAIGWNYLNYGYLRQTSSYFSKDASNGGLRRLSTWLSPTLPKGCWDAIRQTKNAGGLWWDLQNPMSCDAALRYFFAGDSEQTLNAIPADVSKLSIDEQETLVLLKLLALQRLGRDDEWQETLTANVSGALANPKSSRTRLAELVQTLRLVAAIDKQLDELKTSEQSGLLTDESLQLAVTPLRDHVLKLERNQSRVDACLIASLAARNENARRKFQSWAVRQMENSDIDVGTWLRGMYGTLWETPEFQSFARRYEFDIVESVVWHDRNDKQVLIVEALNFKDFADECLTAAKAGYHPTSIAIAERAGGVGIVAKALWERVNQDDWQNPTAETLKNRHEIVWAKKKAYSAVIELEDRDDPSAVLHLLFASKPNEAGWTIRALAESERLSAQKFAQLCKPRLSGAVLLAMANSVSEEVRTDSIRLAKEHLVRRDTMSDVPSAARWVLREQLPDSNLPAVSIDEIKKAQQTPSYASAHEGQTMIVLNGGFDTNMGSRPGEVGQLPNETFHNRRIPTVRYAIGATEVTVAQFRKFRPEVANQTSNDQLPVTQVSWYEAAAYCNWLSEQAGIDKANWVYEPNEKGEYAPGMSTPRDWWKRTGYRLPTEVEWEYSCRGLSPAARPFGDSLTIMDEHCWTSHNSGNRLHPVGQKFPNFFGAFDMLGNASEWCHNSHEMYRSLAGEPSIIGELPGEVDDWRPRSVRGGSALEFHGNERSAFRDYYTPDTKLPCLGFRVCRTIITHQDRRNATKLDAEVLNAFVGQYDYGSAIMQITAEDGQLFAQLTDQPKFPLFLKGKDTFEWRDVKAQVEFVRDDQGVVTLARHSQQGATFDAPKLK